MERLLKRFGIVLLTLSMFTFSSCEKIKDLVKFDFDLEGEAVEVDIPAVSAGTKKMLGSEKFDKSLSQILREQAPDADLNKIKAIKLKNIRAEIVGGTANQDNNFQNFSKIYVEVKANGLSEKVVADMNINDTYSTTLTVPVNGGSIDLKDYFSKSEFEYVLSADVRKATNQKLTVKITADYSFEFGL